MSQQYPGNNPYAQAPQPGPPQPYGQQPNNYPQQGVAPGAQPPPGAYPPPGTYPPPGAFAPPVPVPPQRPSRFGVGLLAGLGAAVVAVVVYGAILRYTDHEIGYVALVVGLLVGGAMGKAGGRNAALPVFALVVSLLGVWFGQLVGIAWTLSSHETSLSFSQIFFDNFGHLVRAWKDDFVDAKDILFFAIAGVEGFIVTRRVGSN
jgi:xanthosine utilization system XapX-like protein